MEQADIQQNYQYLEDENILEGTMDEADQPRGYNGNRDVQYMGGEHSDKDHYNEENTDVDPSYDQNEYMSRRNTALQK